MQLLHELVGPAPATPSRTAGSRRPGTGRCARPTRRAAGASPRRSAAARDADDLPRRGAVEDVDRAERAPPRAAAAREERQRRCGRARARARCGRYGSGSSSRSVDERPRLGRDQLLRRSSTRCPATSRQSPSPRTLRIQVEQRQLALEARRRCRAGASARGLVRAQARVVAADREVAAHAVAAQAARPASRNPGRRTGRSARSRRPTGSSSRTRAEIASRARSKSRISTLVAVFAASPPGSPSRGCPGPGSRSGRQGGSCRARRATVRPCSPRPRNRKGGHELLASRRQQGRREAWETEEVARGRRRATSPCAWRPSSPRARSAGP